MSSAESPAEAEQVTAEGDDRPIVTVVDDERDVADLYAAYLEDEYRVRTAYGGNEALEVIDQAVDVILLDRRMPDRPGDEVLSELRNRGLECQVVMVTAITPDFEIGIMTTGKQAPILVAVVVLTFPLIGALAATATVPSDVPSLTAIALGFGPVVATVTANLRGVFGTFTAQFGFIALSIAALFVDRAVN